MTSSNTARHTWKNKPAVNFSPTEHLSQYKEIQIMSYVINFLLLYLIIAAVLFVICIATVLYDWKWTKKNISSDPAEVLVFCTVFSFLWVLFMKSFLKGLFSPR